MTDYNSLILKDLRAILTERGIANRTKLLKKGDVVTFLERHDKNPETTVTDIMGEVSGKKTNEKEKEKEKEKKKEKTNEKEKGTEITTTVDKTSTEVDKTNKESEPTEKSGRQGVNPPVILSPKLSLEEMAKMKTKEKVSATERPKATKIIIKEKDEDEDENNIGIFAGYVFAITGKMKRPQAEIKRVIATRGGKIANSITKDVTHVIAAGPSEKTRKAAISGLPILTEEWLDASIEAGEPLTDKRYSLEL